MQVYPMTVEGEKSLREELRQLKSEARPVVIAAIAEAREHGDLKENAEYHAAREQQGFIEARIADIEGRLGSSRVINIADFTNNGKVIFGATVTMVNCETDEESVYKIVGEDEADVKQGKISVTSPIARGLVGKEEGDATMVKTPAGVVEYEIDKVEYI
ncbi:transcription elongation factor GreA [Sinobacterium caligoides]|uniref:Transcription elongation factor GreA n=1 Tax=Sinobacterium caligoides TaxID=933926 RepID=A0A3N2DFT2_9GAMM|nr:transcription elongation factor GreA [Sinobacterium caligoides]ROR98652.1 transcription elongation factor GreA [Sinobacterium caligoides]